MADAQSFAVLDGMPAVISPEDTTRILGTALERGADFADLYIERRTSSGISFEDGIVKSSNRGISLGAGVRAVKGDQSGYAFTEDLTPESLLSCAKTAAAIAQENTGKAAVPHLSSVARKSLYNETTSLDLNARIRLVQEADAAARAYSSEISKVSIGLSDEVRSISYANSEGSSYTDEQPMLVLRVSCIAERGTNRQTGSDSGGGRYGLEYFSLKRSAADVAREAARLATLSLDAAEAPAGPMEVVLGPSDSGVLLHEAVGHGLEADFNRKSLSNYSGKIGQRVASDQCTIVDEGLFANMRGSINVDDEGQLPTSSVLIENGILRGYIHDRMSAQIMGAAPTGNGRRESYRHLPMPRMTNTYMMAGKYAPEEIIGTVKKGIYAKRFGGGQVDITKGDFVFTVLESYLIEDGRLTTPLKGVTLIGNGPDVMTKISMAGTDLTFTDGGWTCGKGGQSVPVGMGIPTCKVSEITVGGSRV